MQRRLERSGEVVQKDVQSDHVIGETLDSPVLEQHSLFAVTYLLDTFSAFSASYQAHLATDLGPLGRVYVDELKLGRRQPQHGAMARLVQYLHRLCPKEKQFSSRHYQRKPRFYAN